MNAKVDLHTLTVGHFQPHLNETFRLQLPDGELELKLVQAQGLGQAAREGGAFSLHFVAPDGPFLPQAIFALVHPAMGTLEMFLVPLGPKYGGNCYEAIFA